MAYVHSGSSTWRRELVWRVAEVLKKLGTGGVFVDQTLCTWNCDNGLVENISTSEGMVALTRELSELEGPPAIAGEGRNEMCMRYLSFAQAHLFTSWHKNCDKFEELDPAPVNELLYGELCKTIGYANLAGDDPDSNLRIETHHRLGALPTLCGVTPEQIENPTPGVRRILERATDHNPRVRWFCEGGRRKGSGRKGKADARGVFKCDGEVRF